MTTPYRNELDALRERKTALEQETSRLKEQRSQLEWLTTRDQEIQRELRAIDEKLQSGGRRKLPMLDQITVASPCSASWNEMLGDEKVRFCVSCEKNVYNISAMPKDEAEALIAGRAAGELCVRYYQRTDGTIMTADCPVGVTKKRRKKAALAIAGAGAMAFGAFTALQRSTARHTMGAVQAVYTATAPAATVETPPAPSVMPQDPPPNERHYTAGRMQIRPLAPEADETPKPTPVAPLRLKKSVR